MKSTCETYPNGTREWCNERGELHREDGPAIIYANGSKSWYLKGERHREDGPAITRANGDKLWFLHNKLHRTDGPAAVDAGVIQLWYLNGIQVVPFTPEQLELMLLGTTEL